MIKHRFFARLFPSIILGAGLLAVTITACAPATSTAPPGEPVAVEPTVTAALSPVTETSPSVGLTATPAEVVQPAATSRGPELHATDPATVSLASGGLQFVEFFRFT